MNSATRFFGWIARTCFEGWRTLRRALGSRRGEHPPRHPSKPVPVWTQVSAGIVACVRLDRRAAPVAPPGDPGPSGQSLDPVERQLSEARDRENSARETALLMGRHLPDPSLLRDSGTVFQAAATSSTEPGLIAWVSATPATRATPRDTAGPHR